MFKPSTILTSGFALTVLCISPASRAADDLLASFVEPPDAAKAWCYWWWLDSNASKEGITKDLEEMKRQGIAGALVFDAGEGKGSPVGPLFMSPAWRELFKHTIREADRLGIELTVNICSGWNDGGTWVTPENAAKTLVWSSTEVKGPAKIDQDLPRPKAWDGDYYRDIAVLAFPGSGRPTGATGLKHWEMKAARTWLAVMPELLEEEDTGVADERDCQVDQIVDLSKQIDAAGHLTWDAPAGTWTILRFGYVLLGAKTKCVSPGSIGYEIDFFDPKAMEMHWAQTGAKLIEDAGPLAGKTLTHVHDDSYEVAGPDNKLQQNWTPGFLAEFKARRGYDATPYLPVLAGKIVNNREISNRFLWDYRRTIADLFAAGHYQRLHDLASKQKLGTHPESGGPFWPCIDALQVEGINDIPMGEFWKRVPETPDGKIQWADNYPICDTVQQAASAAHIYGKPICQTESFTSIGPNWEEDFFDLKDIGDKAFCAGLTRNLLCFYVHQPRLDIKPGYQWEMAGTHFDRNVTWWEQSHAWLAYLARCQYLLRQGKYVADLCYYYGEDAPNYVPDKAHMRPALPAGYAYDTINADVLLNRMNVKDGRLVLPDGMSYRILVLPQRKAMSPQVLRKIKQLVSAGATVVGAKPQRAPGLTDYPQCDQEVRALADALWGEGDASAVDRKVGAGRVLGGRPLDEILAGVHVPPDFHYRPGTEGANLDFIHRTSSEAEIYFVSNQLNRAAQAKCFFRVMGKQPEIWDAVTGQHWRALNIRLDESQTVIPLEFAPRQSLFVIFRGTPAKPDPSARNELRLIDVGPLTGPWTVHFDPKWGGPESVTFEKLVDWRERPEPGIKYYSGKAVYEKSFQVPYATGGGQAPFYLDLGRVKNVAEVRVNGKNLGVVWTAPWRVNIGSAVQSGSENKLEITVVNLWPNRLIGDAALPPDKRLTVTNVQKFKADSPLLESGLMGPVVLKISE